MNFFSRSVKGASKFAVMLLLTTTRLTAVASDDSYDLGRRVGDYLGWNVAADAFKFGQCRDVIKDASPRYLNRYQFKEAVDFIRARYKENFEVQGFVRDDVQLERLREKLIRETTEKFAVTLGANPTSLACGFMQAEIETRITQARARLP